MLIETVQTRHRDGMGGMEMNDRARILALGVHHLMQEVLLGGLVAIDVPALRVKPGQTRRVQFSK